VVWVGGVKGGLRWSLVVGAGAGVGRGRRRQWRSGGHGRWASPAVARRLLARQRGRRLGGEGREHEVDARVQVTCFHISRQVTL